MKVSHEIRNNVELGPWWPPLLAVVGLLNTSIFPLHEMIEGNVSFGRK